MRLELQGELDVVNQRMEEANGQLSAQIHLNSTRKQEVPFLSASSDGKRPFFGAVPLELSLTIWARLLDFIIAAKI